ncbi:MAG: sulfatase-like hydrolase/transferase, partial [Clostridia bacterium]|nr:sulfatase-like hydrolase/transferase [Clostridia bacterium]
MKKIKNVFSYIRKAFSFLGKALDKNPILFFAVLSVLENFAIESMSKHSIVEGFKFIFTSPVVFFYNSLIIMLTISFALLFRRRVFGTVLLSAPWLICGLINSVVLTYRVTPLGAIDFQVVRLSLILMYLSETQRILLYAATGVLIVAIITLWIVGPKTSGKMHYGRNAASIVGLAIAVFLSTTVAHNLKVISSDFGNLVGAYNNYGFVYCFSSSMLDTGIDKPSDYSEKTTDKILAQFPQTNDTQNLVKPDVILIQLESFIDPKSIKDMEFSADPAPIHTELKEKFSHGYLAVPSFGGGTANTEFEVLSGINLDYFGPGEYPYKTIMLKKTCETIAFNLKELGYSTHAIHNHTGNFYDRDKVYPNMGFDSFQSKEYMYDFETTPYGWCKDSVLTEEIIKALKYEELSKEDDTQDDSDLNEENLAKEEVAANEDEEVLKATSEQNIAEGENLEALPQTQTAEEKPKFVWAVSVQGHGAYPTEPIVGTDNVIQITKSKGFNEQELCSIQYYVNQVWEMDMFLGSLITALENRERPTLLVAYGDHLPSIGIEAKDVDTNDAFLTEYVTWNNFEKTIDDYKNEKVVKDLRTYELSGEIMRSLGFNNGNLTKL